MKERTFKRHLMTIAFMLFCICINAADDLITSQITIKLDKAGTLPDKIGDSRKYKITNLKIIGEIGGRDVELIRDMAGSNYDDLPTMGNLSILDLSEVKIIKDSYDYSSYAANYGVGTNKDAIGSYFFSQCYKLKTFIFPSTVTSIGLCAFNGCSGLTNVSIPESITYIGAHAFYLCI